MKEARDLSATTCPICSSASHDREIYPANFRPEDLNPVVFSARRLPDRLHYRMVICGQCGLMRANPVLSPLALSVLYGASHAHDPQLSQKAAQTYARYFREYFPSFRGRLLEIGCGPGFFLKELLLQGCDQVHGVEPSSEAVEQSGESKGLIYNGMFTGGIYPKEYFDVICAFQMFDHLSDPRQFLRDCGGYLKAGGSLFLILHNINALPAKILGRSCPMVDIEHPVLYNPETIIKLLEANGFSVQKKFSVFNRYPLRYWLQLMPMPPGLKETLSDFMKKSPVGEIPVTIGAGNMGLTALKKE
jgi:SAM-dependent methyltransferase